MDSTRGDDERAAVIPKGTVLSASVINGGIAESVAGENGLQGAVKLAIKEYK